MNDRVYGRRDEVPVLTAGDAPEGHDAVHGEIRSDGRAYTDCRCGWSGPADDHAAHAADPDGG